MTIYICNVVYIAKSRFVVGKKHTDSKKLNLSKEM